ncbi:MAG: ATP-grasp fold amidoligase family protein [Micrococcaceae bacterium]
MEYWHDYLRRRIEGDEPDVPWFVHDKLECANFCADHRLPFVRILRSFATPDDIDLSDLPSEFVVKPTQLHSAQGVMVLSECENGFYEAFLDRVLTAEEVRFHQREFFGRPELNQPHLSGNRIIVEEKIHDADGFAIPRDFKAYTFGGQVELILMIDRNTSPHTVQWFDRDLRPVEEDRISYNPQRVQVGDIDLTPFGSDILTIAEEASSKVPTPFSRIDLYRTHNGWVIGEITLTPGGLYYGRSYTLSRAYERVLAQRWRDATSERG